MREGTKEAISLDGNVISIIENREGEFVMLRQIEEGDTRRGITIPKDKFKGFVEFQKWRVKENQGEGGSSKGMYIRSILQIYCQIGRICEVLRV